MGLINPLWEGLRALGFKDELLKVTHAGNEAFIQQRLTQWHDHLSPTQIWTDYQQRLAEVSQWPIEQQLTTAIHGKHFFPEVVHVALSQWLGQAKASKRQNQLWQHAIPPEDLQPLWVLMGLRE